MKTLFVGAFITGLALFGIHQDDAIFAATGARAADAPLSVVPSIGVGQWAADPVTIEDAALDGDRLTLAVSYPGGCRVHGFRLVVSSGFLGAEAPSAGALLSHEAFGDNCVATIREQLRFDLRPLREAFEARYGADANELSIVLDDRELTWAL